MGLSETIVRFILRRNIALLIVVALVMVGLIAGISRVSFTTDSETFFGDENPEIVAVRDLNDIYSGTDNVLFMVIPPKGEIYAPATLEMLRSMTEALWQTPYVLRVETPANFTHSWAEGEDLMVEPLLDEFAEITPEMAARFRDVTQTSDELLNRLVSDPPGAYGLSVLLVLPDDFEKGRDEATALLFELRDQWRSQYPEVGIYLTGGIIGGLALADAAFQDATTLVPAAFVLVLLLFYLFLRSAVAVFSSAVVVVLATLVTFGFSGWIGVELTAGTAISPMAVMVLTAASCVHVTLKWLRQVEAGAQDPMQGALSENLSPVFVATITTAIGFLGLRFADSPPLQEMGLIVAFGLMVGMAGVFVILPFAFRSFKAKAPKKMLFSDQRMRLFADWVMRKSKIWLVVFPVIILISVEGISRIGFDDSIVRYFDTRFEFRRDADAIRDHLTGTDNLSFSFSAPDGGSVFEPAFLEQLTAFSDWLKEQETVVAVTGIPNILRRMNKGLNEDDPDFYILGETREANAQLMMFYELSLPVGLDVNNMMDVDRTQTRIVAILKVDHSQEIRDLAQKSQDWLQLNAPEIYTPAVSGSVAFAHVSARNNAQMLYGLGMVLVLVSAILVFALKNLGYGIVSLIPNLLPAILAFGFWGVTFRDVNLGSTVVTTMTFGIIVDDTVHFLMSYLNNRKSHAPREAMRQTFSVVGAAIVITTIALFMGFLVMAASGFAVNNHIGSLTAIVIGFALAADLLFLPSVLLIREGAKNEDS